MTKPFKECEQECTYDPTDRCSWVCSNCKAEADVFHGYWHHCPICGFKITNREEGPMPAPRRG